MVYKYFNIIIWFHKILLTFGCWPYAGQGRGGNDISTFEIWFGWQNYCMEHSRNDFVGKSQGDT